MELKALIELQATYDLAAWHLNRSIVKLILLGQNDGDVPVSTFDKALERAQETGTIINQVVTWIVDNAPESEHTS